MSQISLLLIILIFGAKSLYAQTTPVYGYFVENNTAKLLIFPHKTQISILRSEAIELCRQNNATLVDIETPEKQKIVEQYLNDIASSYKNEFHDFWLSGYYQSNHYVWLNSGHAFNYTNWAYQPSGSNQTYTLIISDFGESDKQWLSVYDYVRANVFCEFKIREMS